MKCLGGSSQSTTISDLSEQEKQLMDLLSGALLPAYLDEAGYDVTTTPIPFEETSEGKRLKETADAHSNPGVYGTGDIEAYRKAKEDYDLHPALSYDVEKRASDAEISDEMRKELGPIEKKYGKDSQKYKDAMAGYGGDKERAYQRDEIQRKYMEKVDKFLSGDLSITPEQEQWITDQYAPIKAAVDSMYTENMEELDKRYADFGKQVDETNLSITSALDVVGAQIKETGANMEKALSSTIASNKELMKMGIYDATGQITKNISMSAIATGRDPSDPEYTNEIQQNIARQVKSGTLQLASMEAQGRMGIAERTGSGLEGVDMAKARLAEATGAKKEGAITAKGQEEAALIGMKGSANIGLEESQANMRRDLAIGLPSQQIGVGQGYQQLASALGAQRLANASGAMNASAMPYGMMAQERFAQPTTTTTQNMGAMDWVGGVMGAAGGAASIYGGVTGTNALRDIADSYT